MTLFHTNVLLGCNLSSCPGGNWQRGSCPTGVMVLWGNCPQGSCPQGSCPQGSCPRGSCPQG